MQENPSFRPHRDDIATALALLTRLPVRARFDRTAEAAWAYPLAGLAVALIAGAVATLAGWLDLGAAAIATLTVAALAVPTGAMHEDGLADCADGFWGGFDRARRLEIMRDSRIGTYGVLALVCVLLIRSAALFSLAHLGVVVVALVAAAPISRAVMVGVMALVAPARADGLSVRTGRPPRRAVVLGALLAMAVGWLVVGFVPMVVSAFVAVLTGFTVAQIARAKIGGQTGDVLGATQILAETAVLLALSALA